MNASFSRNSSNIKSETTDRPKTGMQTIAPIFMIFTPQSLSGLVNLGLKFINVTLTFGGAMQHLISDAHTQHVHQFLTRMLSARISSLHT
jgi:hypothetical protein